MSKLFYIKSMLQLFFSQASYANMLLNVQNSRTEACNAKQPRHHRQSVNYSALSHTQTLLRCIVPQNKQVPPNCS